MTMSDPAPPAPPARDVVIPYSRFLEYLRERRGGPESNRPEPPSTGADTPPVPNQPQAPISLAGEI
jgi:hypothetical protein